ncbi:MAG: hypothetical protein WDW38_011078 [Sanguina aurantia]
MRRRGQTTRRWARAGPLPVAAPGRRTRATIAESIKNQAATDPGAASARQAETPGAYRLAPRQRPTRERPRRVKRRRRAPTGSLPGANQPWSGCGSETIPVYANILHTVENKPGSDRPGSGLGASSGDAGRLPARSPNQAATDPGAASARQAETPGAYRLAPGANQPWSGCGSETIPNQASDRPGSGLGASSGDAGRLPRSLPDQVCSSDRGTRPDRTLQQSWSEVPARSPRG